MRRSSLPFLGEGLLERDACTLGGADHLVPCDLQQAAVHRVSDGLLLKSTIETAVEIKAIKPAELERVIVDTTVMEKAIAHPVDSRLLEIARHKVSGDARDPAHARR